MNRKKVTHAKALHIAKLDQFKVNIL